MCTTNSLFWYEGEDDVRRISFQPRLPLLSLICIPPSLYIFPLLLSSVFPHYTTLHYILLSSTSLIPFSYFFLPHCFPNPNSLMLLILYNGRMSCRWKVRWYISGPIFLSVCRSLAVFLSLPALISSLRLLFFDPALAVRNRNIKERACSTWSVPLPRLRYSQMPRVSLSTELNSTLDEFSFVAVFVFLPLFLSSTWSKRVFTTIH